MCYARVLDYRRKFIEAAQRYNELSYNTLIAEHERVNALKHALICTILASAGKSMLLSNIVHVFMKFHFGWNEKYFAMSCLRITRMDSKQSGNSFRVVWITYTYVLFLVYHRLVIRLETVSWVWFLLLHSIDFLCLRFLNKAYKRDSMQQLASKFSINTGVKG